MEKGEKSVTNTVFLSLFFIFVICYLNIRKVSCGGTNNNILYLGSLCNIIFVQRNYYRFFRRSKFNKYAKLEETTVQGVPIEKLGELKNVVHFTTSFVVSVRVHWNLLSHSENFWLLQNVN